MNKSKTKTKGSGEPGPFAAKKSFKKEQSKEKGFCQNIMSSDTEIITDQCVAIVRIL